MSFTDRTDAGRGLAARLADLRGPDVVVYGLPRGGVPVAYEVALALDAPLDVIVVRKLGFPGQPELAMGAIGEGGVLVLEPRVVSMVDEKAVDRAEAEARRELDERVRRLGSGRDRIPFTGRTALIVDDGIATGSTARAACQVARAGGAERIVLAVPVAPQNAEADLADVADEVIALETPWDFFAVGQAYRDFTQVGYDEVADLLAEARERRTGPGDGRTGPEEPADAQTGLEEGFDAQVSIPAGEARLSGRLTMPPGARGLVIFAHGSGSSRHSPRNTYVAEVLNAGGLGSLLMDLLTEDEELDRGNVFDIDLITGRLSAAVAWAREQPQTRDARIGLFGASTGAAAALSAAAAPDMDVSAVVSRGGRPDLAGDALEHVRAPVLLIVGGADTQVLELNREAAARLRCPYRVEVVPGATHLFEEPGTLRAAAELARDWFARHLA